MPRPDIIETTYKSFSENLEGIELAECKLLLNIDPVCSENLQENIEATKAVAAKYFGEVVVQVPDKPNFTAAVDWCWTTAETEFIFHLEDDWELREKVNVPKVISTMRNDSIKHVILRAYSYKYNKMALSPCIIHRDYYKRFSGDFDYNINPEIQLRKTFVKKEEIIVAGKIPIVFDLGRTWLKTQPFKRPKVKGDFTAWEKTK
jgi:hypothetical protein